MWDLIPDHCLSFSSKRVLILLSSCAWDSKLVVQSNKLFCCAHGIVSRLNKLLC